MPELPDVTVYVERLDALATGTRLAGLRITSPFLLRTVTPTPDALVGARILGVTRLGKRIVFEFEGERFAVIHLMIAGRLRLKKAGAAVPKGNGLAAFDFESGTIVFTEASKKKRASLHLVEGRDALAEFDRQGLEVMGSTLDAFRERLCAENHTLKRALTDPRVLSGIGNAYSDEILFEAGLSPFRQTRALDDEGFERLHAATLRVLERFTRAVREETGDGFPDKVTAFRPDMAVHGRYGQPCPKCEAPVQRIVYAENESNYCARCQTAGKLLADRALSRLLKANWPRRLDDLER